MKNIIVFSLILSCSFFAAAQNYDVASIPEELKENAIAVVRWDKGSYEITDLNHAYFKHHYVVTILKNDAMDMARHDLWYDMNSEIVGITGKIYDKNGTLVKEVKKKDILDAAYSSYSLFEDNRYKYVDLRTKNLPFTFELIFERKFKNLFYAPDWFTVSRDNLSMEYSEFTISAPNELFPHVRKSNTELKPDSSNINNVASLTYKFDEIPAQESEPHGPSIYKTNPNLSITPGKFDFDGYSGSFDSWTDFNNWMLELINERIELSPAVINKVDSLTRDLKTDEEKIKKVYTYLQENTRYVSIQLGIGGYQPFPAMTVNDKKYGDCKALSNYTYALLNAIGIKSHHVLVDAGKRARPIIKEFPNNTFNHMILCVPNQGDTLWLECTSQTNPFGYQGSFTGDRDVFLITEEGGKIVHTTVYDKEDNTQIRSATVNMDANGHGTATIKTTYKGLQYENDGLYYYFTQDHDEQKDWILENTDIPNFELVDFNFEIDKSRIPSIEQEMEIKLPNYCQSSGDRLFLPLNLMNRMTYTPKRLSDRKTDVSLGTPFVDSDSIVFEIPENVHPEFIPEPVSFSNEFGEYESSVRVESGKVIYVRKFGMNKGTFPKESYDELRDFYKKVRKADKSKIVFLKNT